MYDIKLSVHGNLLEISINFMLLGVDPQKFSKPPQDDTYVLWEHILAVIAYTIWISSYGSLPGNMYVLWERAVKICGSEERRRKIQSHLHQQIIHTSGQEIFTR